MEQGSTTTEADGTGLFAGDAWFDPIEAGIRERVRGFIQELLEQELRASVGRGKSERCEQASNPDPTHFGLQGVDLACETRCLAGPQPAPVVTPPFLHF